MCSPFVSVIIPNYCHARYLDQRILSVLDQTYQNFEVIILDDCSPDDGASKSVIEKYRENPHVSHIVYNKVNSGSPYKQWAKGVSLAKGELIWIAESDDYADEHFLEVLVPQFERGKKVSVAFCRSLLFNEDGDIGPAYPKDIEERIYDGRDFIHRYCLLKAGIVNASAAVFRKDVYLSISDIYTTFKGAADKLFWVLIAEKGDVAFVEKPYNHFRQHKNSTTKKLTASGLNQIEDKRIFDYLCEQGHLTKDEIPKFVRWFLKKNVFEMHTDKKIQQEVYHAWHFGRFQQMGLRLSAWKEKLYKILYSSE